MAEILLALGLGFVTLAYMGAVAVIVYKLNRGD